MARKWKPSLMNNTKPVLLKLEEDAISSIADFVGNYNWFDNTITKSSICNDIILNQFSDSKNMFVWFATTSLKRNELKEINRKVKLNWLWILLLKEVFEFKTDLENNLIRLEVNAYGESHAERKVNLAIIALEKFLRSSYNFDRNLESYSIHKWKEKKSLRLFSHIKVFSKSEYWNLWMKSEEAKAISRDYTTDFKYIK